MAAYDQNNSDIFCEKNGYVFRDSGNILSWLRDKTRNYSPRPWGRRLIAGPFVGEIGWELFGWQARLRRLSKFFQETIVIGKEHCRFLYQDFADEYKVCPGDFSGDTSGPLLRDFTYRDEEVYHQKRDLRVLPQTELVRYDPWNKGEQAHTFYEQDFVRFGKKIDQEWEILIHARSTDKASGDYKNWSMDRWNRLIPLFKEYKLASIGSKDGAHHVEGTHDLRGIPLNETADVLRSARMLVSPSSGPVHLAALCCCPHVTWCGLPIEEIGLRRYSRDWNPFHILNTALYDVEWDPDPELVAMESERLLEQAEPFQGELNERAVG